MAHHRKVQNPMNGELKVPPALMREYHQFDGMPVSVNCGSGGFAPSSVYLPAPIRPTTAALPTDYMFTSLVPPDLRFQLTHLRYSDDTLVYELVVPRIVD